MSVFGNQLIPIIIASFFNSRHKAENNKEIISLKQIKKTNRSLKTYTYTLSPFLGPNTVVEMEQKTSN